MKKTNLKSFCPKDWRIGQFLFNFLAWLREKGVPGDPCDRLADTFHLSDKEFEDLLNEFSKLEK